MGEDINDDYDDLQQMLADLAEFQLKLIDALNICAAHGVPKETIELLRVGCCVTEADLRGPDVLGT